MRGSFSAAWTATIAIQVAFSALFFRDLHDLHTFAPLRFQNFSKFGYAFARLNIEFSIFPPQMFASFQSKIANFLSNCFEKFSEFRGKPQRMTKSVEILLKIYEIIRKFAQIVGISEIIQFSD